MWRTVKEISMFGLLAMVIGFSAFDPTPQRLMDSQAAEALTNGVQDSRLDALERNITLLQLAGPCQVNCDDEATAIARVTRKIELMASAYGVDPELAIRVAQCESGLNVEAYNSASGAIGVYQWLGTTWQWIDAQGSRFDEDENIRQFMLNYPKNPQWWSESENCWNG